MPVELAETTAELDVLLARDVLVTEKKNPVIQKSLIDLAEPCLAHWPGDVHVADLDAERVRKLPQFQSHRVSRDGRADRYCMRGSAVP